MKDIKHLPKKELVQATEALFSKKVKELTFPRNPSLFAHDPNKKKTLPNRNLYKTINNTQQSQFSTNKSSYIMSARN